MKAQSAGRISRRALLSTAAGGLALGALGDVGAARAAADINVLMLNAALNQPLRGIVEAATGAKVVDGPFLNTTDVVSRLVAPGGSRYDVMVAGIDFARPPVMGAQNGAERAAALDEAKLSNIANLDPFFAKDVIRRADRAYIVPVFWGYDSVLYNREVLKDEDPFTQSWAPLFEDKFAGRIAWLDAGHQMFMAAALHLGEKDPTNMDKAKVEEVTRFLISRKKNIRTIYSSIAEGTNLLANGEVACLYGPVPMRADLQKKGFKITNAWPKEGVLSIVHAAFVPKDTKNLDGAHAFINAMLGDKYPRALTEACGFLSCARSATTGLSAEEKTRLGYGVLDGTTKSYRLAFPPNITALIEGWNKVKSA